ncbi:MAG TPA: hypothetical protein VGC66_21060 [Pyrinomonadaceae bacterium]|jgi:hypothetical protein
MSVNEVLEAVRAMSPEERAQVRALLNKLSGSSQSSEESVQAKLREAGLLTEARPHQTSRRARHTPVEIKGKPLSETIIEERG